MFTVDKYRFEWMHYTNEAENANKIYLIDNKNELLGIPTTIQYDNLTVNDLESMKKWLEHLNKEK